MSDRREKLDVFESVFRSADKARFEFRPAPLARAVLLTSLNHDHAAPMLEGVRSYLNPVRVDETGDEIQWDVLHWDSAMTISKLKSVLEDRAPGFVAVHRNLGDPDDPIVHSLGVVMDELTQWSPYPVLALPGRDAVPDEPPSSVMVLTDRLAANDHLVSVGAQFAFPKGRLHLVDIEDGATFERYIEVIERIPDINTDLAREKILEKLLDESVAYIDSCKEVLHGKMPNVTVDSEVVLGHHVNDVHRLVNDHDIDLIVMNTRDESQLAMHGMAYAIAVEFREISLLMC